MAAPTDFPGGQQGDELTVEFTVLGQPFVGLNGGPNFKPNEAVSFMVLTEDQEETDRYWNAIVGNGGEESVCGWCKDKWGFSWQITPRVLLEAMTSSDRARRQARVRGDDDDAEDRHRQRSRPRSRARPSMRKLTGAVFMSLDGVMQAPGGPEEDPTSGFRFGGWALPLLGRTAAVRRASSWAITTCCSASGPTTSSPLTGRTTSDNPIGEKFQRINKYVLTHSDEPLDWENSHKLSGDTAEAVAELKQSEGRDLLIQGSSTLYPPLLAAGLIDRLILMTFPVVLGQGKRIFDGSEKPGALKLVEHFVSGQGRRLRDL